MSASEPLSVRTRALDDDGFPRDSWWATTDRAEFSRRQRAEQERMSVSRFGKANSLSFDGMVIERRPTPATDTPTPKVREKGVMGAV